MPNQKLMDRARDELFSHINRCGVLQAAEEDQKQWMDETIDYLAERFPDLSDAQLRELHQVGVRFCKPAIPHGNKHTAVSASEADDTAESTEGANAA